MTFLSANHSPKTVNKNASELTMGTVRDSSTLQLVNEQPRRAAKIGDRKMYTSFPDQQEKPYRASEIYNCIRGYALKKQHTPGGWIGHKL